MQIVLVERELRQKAEALKRCQYNMQCLKRAKNSDYEKAIWQLSQEIFLLEDQLDRYNTVFNLLQDGQEMFDNVPKRV